MFAPVQLERTSPAPAFTPPAETAVLAARPKTEGGLEKLAPLELTKQQWDSLKISLDKAAQAIVGKKTGTQAMFSTLYPGQKIEVLKEVLRLRHPSDEQLEWSAHIQYSSGGEINKASETLEKKIGSCDDLSVLYVSAVKKLVEEGLMKVESIGLLGATYYAPKNKQIEGHMNVVQVTIIDENSLKKEKTTFLVDLAYRPAKIDLGKVYGQAELGVSGDEFKAGALAHLNEGREEQDKIVSAEFEIYNGFDAADMYYYQTKGMSARRKEDYQEAIEMFSVVIGNTHVDERIKAVSYVGRAEAYGILEGQHNTRITELLEMQENKEAQDETDVAVKLGQLKDADFEVALKSGNTGSYVQRGCAEYLLGKSASEIMGQNRKDDLGEAERLLRGAIENASYDDRLYYDLGRVQRKQGCPIDAYGSYQISLKKLDNLANENREEIVRRRKMVEDEIRDMEKD